MKNSSRIHDTYVPYRVGGTQSLWGYLRHGCSVGGGHRGGGDETGEVGGVTEG